MKNLSATMLLLFITTSFSSAKASNNNDNPLQLSETYELANIILALTDYGKTDRWEVYQESRYYHEVRNYFDRYIGHPLFRKVNYSRSQWESYLSFRTDAYGFAFNKIGELSRTKEFYTNKNLKPFEENLNLINDFIKVSGFRKFYKNHLLYYRTIASNYLQSQHYPEMLDFLRKEFGRRSVTDNYAIVMSPLVGRMNCHRVVEGVQTDFISLPQFLINGKRPNTASIQEIATGTHMLFTELDHGFVNPATERYEHLLKENFTVSNWDIGSGYEKDSFGTFNEYVTWAIYDIFLQKYFPSVAETVSANWAIQNETRGFYASTLFNQELTGMYNGRKAAETLISLYPAFIKKIGSLDKSVSRPMVTGFNLSGQVITDTCAYFELHFSEPMQPVTVIDIIRITKNDQNIQINKMEAPQLEWSDSDTVLKFKLNLLQGQINQIVLNYPWKAMKLLKSKKGINFTPYSILHVNVSR